MVRATPDVAPATRTHLPADCQHRSNLRLRALRIRQMVPCDFLPYGDDNPLPTHNRAQAQYRRYRHLRPCRDELGRIVWLEARGSVNCILRLLFPRNKGSLIGRRGLSDPGSRSRPPVWFELALISPRNRTELSKQLQKSGKAVILLYGELYGPPEPDPKLPDSTRKNYHPGWGHLGAFPMMLVVFRIESVSQAGKPYNER